MIKKKKQILLRRELGPELQGAAVPHRQGASEPRFSEEPVSYVKSNDRIGWKNRVPQGSPFHCTRAVVWFSRAEG